MQYPNDKNGAALQSMFDKGVKLDRTYEIDFLHFFNDEGAASKMIQEIELKFSDIKVSTFVNKISNGVDVYVSKLIAPTHQLITEHELDFGEIAVKFGGKSDGWGFQSEYNK